MFSINLTHREPSVITRADRARDAGNWEIAVRLYRIALSRNPSKPSIWIQYGHALKESGNIADAETAYGTALAYDPEDGDAHLQLGHVLKLQGKLVEAKAAYSRAFMFDNSATEARRELREFGLTDQEISEYRLSAKVGLQCGTASTPTRASIITRADRALA